MISVGQHEYEGLGMASRRRQDMRRDMKASTARARTDVLLYAHDLVGVGGVLVPPQLILQGRPADGLAALLRLPPADVIGGGTQSSTQKRRGRLSSMVSTQSTRIDRNTPVGRIKVLQHLGQHGKRHPRGVFGVARDATAQSVGPHVHVYKVLVLLHRLPLPRRGPLCYCLGQKSQHLSRTTTQKETHARQLKRLHQRHRIRHVRVETENRNRYYFHV